MLFEVILRNALKYAVTCVLHPSSPTYIILADMSTLLWIRSIYVFVLISTMKTGWYLSLELPTIYIYIGVDFKVRNMLVGLEWLQW